MSDKSNKGGGGKGRPPTRSGAPKSGPKRAGGARPFRADAAGGKPFRKREAGDRPFRPRPEGDSAARARDGEGGKPFRKREGDDRPFRSRPEGGDRPFRPRPEGDRPARARDGEGGKPFRKREGGDRPFRSRPEGGDRPFRPRPEGDRPTRARDGEPFRKREGGDRPFRAREGEGAGQSFGQRQGGDKPYRPRPADGDRPFRPRPEGGRAGGEKPFRSRPDAGPPARGGASVKGRERPAPRPEFRPIAAEPEALQRVAKVIARAGLCSRRDAETWIEEGRVAVNGETLQSPARDVGPADIVTVDGDVIPSRERTRLFLYHKPRGLMTTARDPEGRATVFDNLPPDLPRLVSVGRLDYNTEGLLILTNDGGLARVLELPDTGWLRRYRVRAFGDTTQERLDALSQGVSIDGIHYGPIESRLDRRQGDNVWLTLGLREGKNREVKRILDHLGLDVNRLIRLSFGPFQLGDLAEGAVEEVRTRVLMDQLGPELAAEAGVDFDAPIFMHEPDTEPRVQEAQRFAKYVEEPREIERPARPKRRGRLEPVTSVWRADADDAGLKRRAPGRREADPRFARQESATREHRRGGHVETRGGRRVLVEKLVPDPAAQERPAQERPIRERSVRGRVETRRPGQEPGQDLGQVPDQDNRPAAEAPARTDSGDERRAERRTRFERAPSGEERPKRRAAPAAGRDADAARPRRSGEDRPRRFEPRPDRPARESRGDKSEPRAFAPRGAAKRDGNSANGRFGKGKSESGRSGPGGSGGFGGAPRPPGAGKPRGGPGDRPGGGKPQGGRPGGGGRPPRAG